MAIGEVVSALPPQIANNIGLLIKILQAIGIAVIVYVLYLIIMGFFAFKRIKRMKNIEKTVESIEKKMNILLKNKKKK